MTAIAIPITGTMTAGATTLACGALDPPFPAPAEPTGENEEVLLVAAAPPVLDDVMGFVLVIVLITVDGCPPPEGVSMTVDVLRVGLEDEDELEDVV